MHKTRPAHDQVAVTEINGTCQGQDRDCRADVIMTGGTLIANVPRPPREGRQGRLGFSRRTVSSADTRSKTFHDAPIDGIVVTDTVPINPLEMPPNMTILPVAQLLAETIMNVFEADSVSAIFGGENQLF